MPVKPTLALIALLAMQQPGPAMAEFLAPDWAGLTIEGLAEPDWITGVRDGNFIGMCTSCSDSVMLQVQTLPDDGTGERVRSGETTTETYDAIGKANAEQLGNGAQYFGTEPLTFATGKGFKTRALSATGDYASTFQLWSDGQQLLVKVYGKDKKAVEDIAQKAFDAAAPLTFQ